MVIHYYYSSPTTSFEDTVLATPGRQRPSLTVPFISYRFGSVISVNLVQFDRGRTRLQGLFFCIAVD